MGNQQLERVQKEMRTRFVEMGYPADKSLPELFARLTQEQGIYFGAEVLATSRSLVTEAERRVQTAFNLPPNFPMVEIKPSTMGNFYRPVHPTAPVFFMPEARSAGVLALRRHGLSRNDTRSSLAVVDDVFPTASRLPARAELCCP